MKLLLALSVVVSAAFGFSTAQAADGDAKAGEKKAVMCIGCHGIPGYQASFPEVHRVPRISGQHAKYIVSSLTAYAKGDRKHPTMRGIATGLSEQDMADLGAFYAQHGKDTTPAVPKELAVAMPESLKPRLATCVACHGTNFNDTVDPGNPRLSGQYADYLYVALKSYKITGNPNLGRANATMGAMVAGFNDGELRQIANYLGSLPTELKTVPQSRFR